MTFCLLWLPQVSLFNICCYFFVSLSCSELLNDHDVATPPSPPLQLSDLPEDQLPSPSLFPPTGVELRDKEHSSMDPTSFFLRKCSTLLSPGTMDGWMDGWMDG